MTTKHAFPDTNVFLHFRPLDEIDWLGALGADDVRIVIAPIVLRELNRQKDSVGNKRLRSRAAQAIKKLERFSSAPTLRQGVEVQFQTADPQIDFAPHRLSPQIPDDWLIASAIEFAMDHQDVCVVSNDLGLRMKLPTHNIPAFRLPEEYRLPEEPDPDQKTIAQLRDELRAVKDRLPDIKLTFADGEDRLHIILTRSAPIAQSELDNKMQNLRIRFPKMLKLDRYSGADLASGTVESPAATDAYNAKLDHFYSEVSEYLREYESFADRQHRQFTLELILVNTGTAPAEDVDISLAFPDGLEVLERRDLPSPPVQPESPPLPLSRGERRSLSSAELLRSMPTLAPVPEITGDPTIWSNVSRPFIQKSNSYSVALNVKELKHRCSAYLTTLYIAFASWKQASSFEVAYSLLARNLPQPIHGRLNVIVTISKDLVSEDG